MTALVLGASGFIGSWVVRALLERDVHTVVLTRPESNLWRLEGTRPDFVVAVEDQWGDAIRSLKPDVVISLDWSGVGGSHRDDELQWENLRRSHAVLDAAAQVGVRRFVGVGSQAEYGPKNEPITEDMATSPTTAYGRAKLAAMELSRDYCAERGLEWVWARVFSAFGPLDNGHWLLPLIADALMHDKDIELSEGSQLWSYIHGADAGRAFATLATHPGASGVYNLGHPSAPPLRSTIEKFAEHFTSTGKLLFGALPLGQNAVTRLEPDMSRLNSLGWQPSLPLDEGLRSTARWLQGETLVDPLSPRSALPVRR